MSEVGEPPEAIDQGSAGGTECCGTFRFFVDAQRWEWSGALARMHGYQPGTIAPSNALLLQQTHPEDRARVAAILRRVKNGALFSSRHRIIDAAGRTHWVVVVGDSARDDTGKVIGTSGFYIDVTEELEADIKTVVTGVTASRDRIEQAKGVLMATYGVSAERAFDVLVWRSQQTNTKVRNLAERFLDAISGNVSSETLTHVDHALLNL